MDINCMDRRNGVIFWSLVQIMIFSRILQPLAECLAIEPAQTCCTLFSATFDRVMKKE